MAISSGLQGTANTYLLKFIFSVKVFPNFFQSTSEASRKDRDRQSKKETERGLEPSQPLLGLFHLGM